MQKGDNLSYFVKPVTVLAFDKTHCVVEFENGTKLCTNRNTFDKPASGHNLK